MGVAMTSPFKNRLERLHGSRKRAQERQQEDEERGAFSADQTREMETPPGEPPPEEPDDHPDDSDETERADTTDSSDTVESDDKAPSDEQLDDLRDMTIRRAEPESPAREPADGRSGDQAPDDMSTKPEPEPEPAQPNDDDHRETEVGQRLARRYSLRDRSDDDAPAHNDQSTSNGRPKVDRSKESDRVSHETSRSEPPNERAERLRKYAAEHLSDGDWDAALPLLHEILALLPRHSFALQKLVDFHRDRGNRQLADHYESRLRKVAPF